MAIHMKMILLSVVMLLIAFEPAFSGKILRKLDKELKKMGLKKLQKFLAKIGTNADEIDSNKEDIGGVQNDVGDVQNNIVSLVKLKGYPDVDLYNNYISNITGHVHYTPTIFCKKDGYNILYNTTFHHSRGVCLITRISGYDTNNGNECHPYSSPGTSYHKFQITTANPPLVGCTVTRVVN